MKQPSQMYSDKNKPLKDNVDVHTKKIVYGNQAYLSRSSVSHQGAWQKNPLSAKDLLLLEVENDQKLNPLNMRVPSKSVQSNNYRYENFESLPCSSSAKAIEPVRKNSLDNSSTAAKYKEDLVIQAEIIDKKSDVATQLSDLSQIFSEIKIMVNEFRGNKDNKLFKYLDEMLTLLLIHLDGMKTAKGTEEHELRRKLYKEINRSNEELERRVDNSEVEAINYEEAIQKPNPKTHRKNPEETKKEVETKIRNDFLGRSLLRTSPGGASEHLEEKPKSKRIKLCEGPAFEKRVSTYFD